MSDDGRFFLNDHSHYSFQFSPTHPEAANIMSYVPHSSLYPGLTGIRPLTVAMWKRTKQPHDKFYRHSYTAPTLSTFFFLQQFGLACTFAIHLWRKASNVASPQTRLQALTAPPMALRLLRILVIVKKLK